MPSLWDRIRAWTGPATQSVGGPPGPSHALHRAAVRRGEPTYDDPESGHPVFTAQFLKSRGHCCGSYCRHCPYGPQAQREAAAHPPPDTEH